MEPFEFIPETNFNWPQGHAPEFTFMGYREVDGEEIPPFELTARMNVQEKQDFTAKGFAEMVGLLVDEGDARELLQGLVTLEIRDNGIEGLTAWYQAVAEWAAKRWEERTAKGFRTPPAKRLKK